MQPSGYFACDIVCTPPKAAIKGQAIADFLASFPVDDGTPLEDDIPAEIMKIEASWANYLGQRKVLVVASS